jgi:fructokinase
MSPPRLFGAIEAGGTKFVCGIGDETGRLLVEERFPTTEPAVTIGRMLDFLRRGQAAHGRLEAIGVGSFGPVQLDRQHAQYGWITRTPKPGWNDTDLLGPLRSEFGCTLAFDTDVNAAALAEHRWGAATDVASLVYITVGTGIGGGVLVDGRPVHGLMHPEIGHLYPRRHPLDRFAGRCPFHHDCMEGLASGPAIQDRCGTPLQDLDAGHVQWEIEADYLGQLCAQLVVTVSPQRIVMGGGVMNQTRLLPPIRERMLHWLGSYIVKDELLEHSSQFVVAPKLGGQAGLLGALVLALDAAAAPAPAP